MFKKTFKHVMAFCAIAIIVSTFSPSKVKAGYIKDLCTGYYDYYAWGSPRVIEILHANGYRYSGREGYCTTCYLDNEECGAGITVKEGTCKPNDDKDAQGKFTVCFGIPSPWGTIGKEYTKTLVIDF